MLESSVEASDGADVLGLIESRRVCREALHV
jgi:hypothetical protein